MDIPQAVTDARSEAGRLGGIASDYASSEYTIPDQLKKVVQEALNYNQDIVGMRSKALADYQASPAVANAKFGVQNFGTGPQTGQANPDFIFNPFERNAAIETFKSNQSIPFSFANTLLGMREGTSADVIGAGTRAFQAQSSAAQAASTAARQTYVDVLNEYKTAEDIKNAKRELDIKQQTANQSGGSDLTSTLALLEKLLGGSQTSTTKTANPLDAFIESDVNSFDLGKLNFDSTNNLFTNPNQASSATMAPPVSKPAVTPLSQINLKLGELMKPKYPNLRLSL